MVFRGGWLLLLLILGLTTYDLSRSVLYHKERPALYASAPHGAVILITGMAQRLNGVHQINGALTLYSVINLASYRLALPVRQKLLQIRHFEDGEAIKFQLVNDQIMSIKFGWMPAAMRMSLAIPLRVERMTQADWDDLPGVGPSLAQKIDNNRQTNGEFSSFANLKRVKGVGLKRLEKWRIFFVKN